MIINSSAHFKSPPHKRRMAEQCPSKDRRYKKRAPGPCTALSPHEKRILDALKDHGNERLYDSTLLNRKVHTRHAKALYQRACRLFGISATIKQPHLNFISKFGYCEQYDHLEHRKTLRWITVIHSVEATKEAALRKCLELKAMLKHELGIFKGLRMIGSIEVEMFPLKLALALRQHLMEESQKIKNPVFAFAEAEGSYGDNAEQNQFRKLDNCIALAKLSMVDLENTQSSVFLVHFHGLIAPVDGHQLMEVRSTIQGVAKWSKAPRQIMIRKMHSPNEKSRKLLTDEIRECCKYATKMGKRQHGRYSYLKYNIDVPLGFELSSLGSNFSNEAIVPTPFEINEIHVLTYQLMNSSGQGNGHTVTVNNRSFH
jgi:hypothetical protein